MLFNFNLASLHARVRGSCPLTLWADRGGGAALPPQGWAEPQDEGLPPAPWAASLPLKAASRSCR